MICGFINGDLFSIVKATMPGLVAIGTPEALC